MAEQGYKVEDKNYIELIKEAQEKLPKVVLPSMGLVDHEEFIDIHGKDFFNKSDSKES